MTKHWNLPLNADERHALYTALGNIIDDWPAQCPQAIMEVRPFLRELHDRLEKIPAQPSYRELLAFVRRISLLVKYGDVNSVTDEEYMTDGDDEEIDTLYSLISEARGMLREA